MMALPLITDDMTELHGDRTYSGGSFDVCIWDVGRKCINTQIHPSIWEMKRCRNVICESSLIHAGKTLAKSFPNICRIELCLSAILDFFFLTQHNQSFTGTFVYPITG